MKNSFRYFGVAFLLSLYSFVVLAAVSMPNNLASAQPHTTEQQQFLSAISSNQFTHIVQSESAFLGIVELPEVETKRQLDDLRALCNFATFFYQSEYAQYRSFAKNILTQYRKSDLIFPFHYFW